MLEGLPGYISHKDAVQAHFFIINCQRDDGAIPDRVELDGRPFYQVLGSKPPTDNPQFAVKIAWEMWHYIVCNNFKTLPLKACLVCIRR